MANSVTDNKICAVNKKEGFCHGDSGGPLITFNQNGTYQQIGIVSFNDVILDITKLNISDPSNLKPMVTTQCLLESPNAFSRVTAELDWIKEMIKR